MNANKPDRNLLAGGPSAGLAGATPLNALPVNAMTVDVEEYFQVGAFESCIDRSKWDDLESRLEISMDIVLRLLGDAGVRGTFFFLGWIAERHPDVVRRVAGAGHEIASHGYDHRRITGMTADSFREDIKRTSGILADITGHQVRGYRAPSFSICATNLWALEVLAEEGYAYSSSIYPIHHDHYGMPSAPRFMFNPVPDSAMIEVPVTTVSLAGRKIPCGGGGYFRLLPYGLSKYAIGRVNREDGQSTVFYCHPWEFDPGQPRQKAAGARSRFRHYTNIGRMERKVRRLLVDFRWGRMDEIFLPPNASGQVAEVSGGD